GVIPPGQLGQSETVAEFSFKIWIEPQAVRPARTLQFHVVKTKRVRGTKSFDLGTPQVERMLGPERAIEAQPRRRDPELAFAVVEEVSMPGHEADGGLALEGGRI